MAVIQKDRLPVLASPRSSSHTFSLRPRASPSVWTTTRLIRDHGIDLVWDLHLFGFFFVFHLKTYTHIVSSTAFTQGSWGIVKLHPLFEWGMRDLSKNVVGNSTPVVLQYQGKTKRCSGMNPQPAPSPDSHLLLPSLQLRAHLQSLCHKEHSYPLKAYLKFSFPVKPSENKFTIE